MCKTKGILSLLLLLIGATVSAQSKMSPSEAITFKSDVEKYAQNIHSMRADFEASKHVSVLKSSPSSSGILKLKENKLLWQYNPPRHNAMLFDQDKLYMKDDKGKRSTVDLNKSRRFRQLQQLIAAGNMGNVFDETNFHIDYWKNGTEKFAILTPKNKDMARFIKEIVLTFKDNERTVSEVKIVERTDDYTIFKLRNKKINIAMSDSEFKL